MAQDKFTEITPDGHIELVEGKEPLKKKPKKKLEKTAYERWEELKKFLSNKDAFMDLAQQEGDDESDETASGDGEDDVQGSEGDVDTASTAESQGDQSQGMEAEEPAQEEQQEETQEVDQEQEIEALIEALKEEGHSEAEINYIIHGHGVNMPDKDEHAANNEMLSGEIDREAAMSQMKHDGDLRDAHANLEISHKKRMNDVEYENAKGQSPDPSLEKEHKKRMLDLEYENAKANMKQPENQSHVKAHEKKLMDLEYKRAVMEMEIEIEFKQRELELKLKQMEQAAKMKAEQEKLKGAMKLEEMANPHEEDEQPKAGKKPAKKLKKTEDEQEEDLAKEDVPYWHPKAKKAMQIKNRVIDTKVKPSKKPMNIITTDSNQGFGGAIAPNKKKYIDVK